MLPEYFEFHNAAKVLSGRLSLDHIAHEFRQLGVSRPLLVSDAQLDRLGAPALVADAMAAQGMPVIAQVTDIPADSSVTAVNAIADRVRALSCDALIAVGGGSVIDTAKGVAMVIAHKADDLLSLMGCEVLGRGEHMPLCAVPTTAGTGSEVTMVAVVRDDARAVKMEFIADSLLPDLAVLDPRLTMKLPARITAATGMDALCHAVEAYTCLQHNPISDAYATGAIGLITRYLLPAAKGQGGVEARMGMANAALMAGSAFSNAMVGAVHAIGHALGGECRVAHGDAMAILLPHVMERNLNVCEQRYGELLLPLCGPQAFVDTAPDRRGAAAIAAIRSLLGQLGECAGLPTRLSQTGAKRESFARVAELALNDGAMIVNPISFTREQVLDILNAAF